MGGVALAEDGGGVALPSGEVATTELSLVSAEATEAGWRLEVSHKMNEERFATDDSRWRVELSVGPRVIAVEEAGASHVTQLARELIEDGAHAMIASTLIRFSGESGPGYVYLRRSGDSLVEESLEDHIAGRSVKFGDTWVFEGAVSSVPPRAGLEDVAPWDNPDVQPEDRAWAAENTTSSHEGALTAKAETVDAPAAGCGAGSAGLGAAVVLLGVVLVRRRRWGSVAALMLVSVGSSASRATVVYGYVAFWDTRTGSSATGSRLSTCNTADTTCAANATNCCTRGLPMVRVELWDKTGQLATTTSGVSGYFQFPDRSFSTVQQYTILVTYTRTGYPTTQFITTSSSGTTPANSTAGSFYGPTGSFLNLGTLRVNNAPDSSNSNEGNYATVWHATTKAFLAMEIEGETRQRIEFGSGNSYDTIAFRSTNTNTNRVWCPSTVRFAPSTSRTSYLPATCGIVLVGRAVDCDPTTVRPTFPQTPIDLLPGTDSSSESYRLLEGFGQLATLLTFFDPQTSTIADVKSGTGISCFYDTVGGYDLFENSNSAAWAANNALALWDLIDADTSSTDDGVSDNVDFVLPALVEALYMNSVATGSLGQNRKYNEFWYYNQTTTCAMNEDCGNGEACLGPTGFCHSGDPHGGNIGDLAYHLGLLQGTYGWPGNIPNTLKSSLCLYGAPDNSYPFNGSYRDD